MNQLQVLNREESAALSVPLTANDILAQVRLIQEVMQAVMKDKEHFGTIPGCGDKPTLLQPGAQKLLMTFRLAPEYEIFQTDQERGHREYRVQCTLKSISSGNFCGTGVGCCSTMEGKFRFRVAPKQLTDRPVPKEYWELRGKDAKAAQQLIGGPGFSTKKDDNGQWMIAEGSSEKVEHDNPADYYNTVLKMAKKRALVDATLTATAASDIFTQDIEDMPEVINVPPQASQSHAPASTPPSATSSAPRQAQTQTRAPQQSAPNADEVTIEATFVDYKEKTGTSGKGPWTMFICGFEDGSGAFMEAITFDKKIGDTLDTLKGGKVALRYKPGRKPSQFDIVSLQPADEIPM